MSGTGVGLIIGFVYGAVLGIYAYRWWQREQSHRDGQLADLRSRQDALMRRLLDLAPEPAEAAL